MAKGRLVLPQECWELIFNRVDNLKAISLVSKEFCSISNRSRHTLKVRHPELRLLSLLLKRFQGLKRIDLSHFGGNIDLALLEIARSGLNLEALDVSNQRILPVESLRVVGMYMKNLKTLACTRLGLLQDSDLKAIADSLPWLEELDISFPHHSNLITDDGIEVLAFKLHRVTNINLSSCPMLTDSTFSILTRNCPSLEEIEMGVQVWGQKMI